MRRMPATVSRRFAAARRRTVISLGERRKRKRTLRRSDSGIGGLLIVSPGGSRPVGKEKSAEPPNPARATRSGRRLRTEVRLRTRSEARRAAAEVEVEVPGARASHGGDGEAERIGSAQQTDGEARQDQCDQRPGAWTAFLVAPGGVVAHIQARMKIVGDGDHREEQECDAGERDDLGPQRMPAGAARASGGRENDACGSQQPGEIEQQFQAFAG